MLVTFLTTLSTIYVIVFILIVLGLLWQFINLTPYQQKHARVTINPIVVVGFMVSLSFLIARMVT